MNKPAMPKDSVMPHFLADWEKLKRNPDEHNFFYFDNLLRIFATDYDRLSAEVEALKERAEFLNAMCREAQEFASAYGTKMLQQQEEMQALRKDALRYRWLRTFDRIAMVDEMLNSTEFNTLDAAVDQAMARIEEERNAKDA